MLPSSPGYGVLLRAADPSSSTTSSPTRWPWEVGLAGIALGHRPLLPPLHFGNGFLLPYPSVSGETIVGPTTRRPMLGHAFKKRRIGVGATESDEIAFGAICRDWGIFLAEDVGLQHCALGRRFLAKDESDPECISREIQVLFAGKPTSTLTKRLGSMKFFARWAADFGVVAFPVLPDTALVFLKESAAKVATRGLSFRGALAFSMGFFGLDGAEATLNCKLCAGAMYAGLAQKRVTVQAPPLTVSQVSHFELLVRNAPEIFDRVLAGFVLLCIHGRLRAGDAIGITTEPVLDLPSEDGSGFIETRAIKHKTAARGSRLPLPIVALSRGVGGSDWGSAWLEARSAAGLDASSDDCLLPAFDRETGWMAKRADPGHVTDWMRAELADSNVSSRSCKPTVLSWTAKHGMPKSARRTLGYHVKPKDRTMTIYSRDELAVPLRLLAAVYADISGARFRPDMTRSGHWVRPNPFIPPCSVALASNPAEAPPITDFKEAADIIEGSRSSSSSSPSQSPSPSCNKESDDEVHPAACGYVMNLTSKMMHINDDGVRMMCGKAVGDFKKSVFLSAWPVAPGRLCAKCFR